MTVHRPLSTGQQAMWFIHRLAPDSAAYNVTLGVRVRSPLDPVRLAWAVAAVEDRHDVLRTTFVETEGQPWRVVQPSHAGVSPRLEVRDIARAGNDRLLELARRSSAEPFALTGGGRPFRVVLLRRASDDAILVITAHHIVADATSLFLILRDLLEAFAAVGNRSPVLSPLRQTYDDFVSQEQRLLASPRASAMAEHWAAIGTGAPVAQLLADRPAPAHSSYAGATRELRTAAGFAGRLRTASRAAGVTPFAYLLGAFQALLHRYTGLNQFVIGTAVSLRFQPGLRDVVGYMVNALPMRARFTATTTLADTVAAASEQIRHGVAQAAYPRPLMKVPPFRITCTMLTVDRMAVPLPAEHAGLRLSYVDIPQQEGQFDLSVELRYSCDSLGGVFRYDADLFERTTIDDLAERFARVADLAVNQPQSKVADVPLVDEAELGRLLAFGQLG